LLFSLFLGVGLMYAQTKVSGTVISDEDGQPVVGAAVQAVGQATIGTITDYDGKFVLELPASVKLLKFSYVGLEPVELPVKSVMNVRMKSSAEALDEVMVVAYGTSKKSSFTGSASVVSGKELEKLQTSNITKSLEGTVAGIQMTSSSGQPGSSASIYVRGIGSISANQNPLYVVDGVPYEGSMNSIAPNDIESMTVLKDAAANSLYGSRGANGVILITTKKGREGKARITVDARWGGNRRANSAYDVLENPATYYEMTYESLYNEAVFAGKYNPTQATAYAQGELLGLTVYNNYKVPEGQTLIDPATGLVNPNAQLLYHNNWIDEAFKKGGMRQEYNVSLSGGTDKSNYYTSFGFLDDDGYVPNSKFKRYTTRMKVDQEITKWLKAGANLSYANTTTNSVLENSSQFSNIFMFAQNIAPIYPVYLYDQTTGELIYDAQGKPRYDYGVPYPEYGINEARPYGSMSNPLGTMRDDTRERKIDYVSGKAYANINLPVGFTFTSNISYDLYNYNDLQFMTPLAGDAANVNGRGSRETRRFTSIYWNQLLNWEKTFNNVHTVKGLLGHETTQNDWMYMSGDKSNFFDPYNPEFDNAVSIDGLTSSTEQYTQEGYFIRGEYDYNNRYYLSGSFRTDGSSKFHPDTRWGNFWSAGASWRINQESWMQDARWVDNLKLKVSYGTQGNDGLPNMQPYKDQYNVVPVSGQPGIDWVFRGNPDLTWEKSENFNAGIEFGFFDNRLTGNVEYFIKNTRDMLYSRTLPPSDGAPFSIWVNDIDMRNNGFEFDLTGVIIKNNDWRWSVTLNGTTYKNKLTKLPSDKDPNGYQSGSYWREKGGSLYDYYMVEYSRIDPETGSPLFWGFDESGNRVEKTSPSNNDAVKIGKSSLPKFFGGISTNLSWKGFDLSLVGAFSLGGYTYDSNYANLMQMQSRGGGNWHKDILKRWTPENTNTNVPRVQNGAQTMSSVTNTYFLTSSSYFSLRNVTLGYSLPSSILNKIGVGGARFYVVADNVFLATKRAGMDPRTSLSGSVGNTYAPIRTISGGVSLNF
ncbi:MAG: SusC/RagA family TonB-linked outer membrane protein, partial [Bacteroidales bacterium]